MPNLYEQTSIEFNFSGRQWSSTTKYVESSELRWMIVVHEVCKLSTQNTISVYFTLDSSERVNNEQFFLQVTDEMIVNNRFVNCSNCHRQEKFSIWRVFATLKPAQHEFAISSSRFCSLLPCLSSWLSRFFI